MQGAQLSTVSAFKVSLYYRELPSPTTMLPHSGRCQDLSEAGGRKSQQFQSRGIDSSKVPCLVGGACFIVQQLLLPHPCSFHIVCTKFYLSIGFTLNLVGLGGLGGSFVGSLMPGRRDGAGLTDFEE